MLDQPVLQKEVETQLLESRASEEEDAGDISTLKKSSEVEGEVKPGSVKEGTNHPQPPPAKQADARWDKKKTKPPGPIIRFLVEAPSIGVVPSKSNARSTQSKPSKAATTKPPRAAPDQEPKPKHPGATAEAVLLPLPIVRFAHEMHGLRCMSVLNSGFCGLHFASIVTGLEELEVARRMAKCASIEGLNYCSAHAHVNRSGHKFFTRQNCERKSKRYEAWVVRLQKGNRAP
jgi:hypothetical protein